MKLFSITVPTVQLPTLIEKKIWAITGSLEIEFVMSNLKNAENWPNQHKSVAKKSI
jgi:hypothetical protein